MLQTHTRQNHRNAKRKKKGGGLNVVSLKVSVQQLQSCVRHVWFLFLGPFQKTEKILILIFQWFLAVGGPQNVGT